jgi:hypothetical protein
MLCHSNLMLTRSRWKSRNVSMSFTCPQEKRMSHFPFLFFCTTRTSA